jgi:hypothetical protein
MRVCYQVSRPAGGSKEKAPEDSFPGAAIKERKNERFENAN